MASPPESPAFAVSNATASSNFHGRLHYRRLVRPLPTLRHTNVTKPLLHLCHRIIAPLTHAAAASSSLSIPYFRVSQDKVVVATLFSAWARNKWPTFSRHPFSSTVTLPTTLAVSSLTPMRALAVSHVAGFNVVAYSVHSLHDMKSFRSLA